MYDVVVVGAGVSGCAIARELSRYELSACVLEMGEDVCCGTSKANSGIVHSGIDAEYGTKKAEMNVLGNQMMEKLARELDFPFRQNGSLIVCFDEEGIPELEKLIENGKKNGVPGLRLLAGSEARQLEPNLSEGVVAAAYAPTGGIVCPFGLTIALAENAADNGVEFRFLAEVKGIRRTEAGFVLQVAEQTGLAGKKGASPGVQQGEAAIEARCIVNAAGIGAGKIHNMVSGQKRTILPRRGEYCLYDKSEGALVDKTIFQLPTQYGKGVLVTPTVHGNLMMGPTATDVTEEDGVRTTAAGLAEVAEKACLSVAHMPGRKVITSFAGLRAHTVEDDFTLGEALDVPGFFDVLGIESPGLTAAPAIGVYMAGLVAGRLGSREKAQFKGTRRGILNPAALPTEERNRLIVGQPAYGAVVCRCESVTEGEILDAIHRTLGAKSLDGVKRRTRAGMGRCQAGFCSPKVVEILARELGVEPEDICKAGPGSEILAGGDI